MITWLISIGNSDVQLKNLISWSTRWSKYSDDLLSFEPPRKIKKYFPVYSRPMGILFPNISEPEVLEELAFPLLNNFAAWFQKKQIAPERIIYLLTDQTHIFDVNTRESDKDCPYWQDTCGLEKIIHTFFKIQYPNAILECLVLIPALKGIDHWDSTLSLMMSKLPELELESNQDLIYVSHQAGTPAMSSALQFISLSKYGNLVHFLLSNHIQNDVEEIGSSKYLLAIQRQEAKRLVREGLPGGALSLMKKIDTTKQYEELTKLVDFFNLRGTTRNRDRDFEKLYISRRIRSSLDLIEIFINQGNYLQGITLLSAVHETFLKAAIMEKVKNKSSRRDFVVWNESGLKLNLSIRNKKMLANELNELVNDELKRADFPSDKIKEVIVNLTYDDGLIKFPKIDHNSILVSWFKTLYPEINGWHLLDLIGNRKNDDNLRNQLMHNLRGVEAEDVIKCLSKASDNNTDKNVTDIYTESVKQPFIDAMEHVGFSYDLSATLFKRLDEVAESL